MSEWILTEDKLPPNETPVLIVYRGMFMIGEIRWDHPGHEDTYNSYWYWDNPYHDGQCWESFDVTHWMPFPELPECITKKEEEI